MRNALQKRMDELARKVVSSPLPCDRRRSYSRRTAARCYTCRGWIAILLVMSITVLLGTSIGAAPDTGSETPLVVGFLYVGPKDDLGLNQAHAQGAAAIRKLKGVKVLEEENVPETEDAEKSMKRMIVQGGATLLFPTSFGYFDPHIVQLAKDYPKVTFLHCSKLYDEKRHPKNVGCYYGYIDECQYISGIVAAHMSKSKKIGVVAAKPIPLVRRDINAFALGARSINPAIECRVVFTGEWLDPVKEQKATNDLIDQGVDVLTCHIDSPKVVAQQAEKRKVFFCGYHTSQALQAPKYYLTGAEWNWEKVYTDYVTMVKEGKKLPNVLRGGLKEGIVKMSPYGSAVSEAAKKNGEAVRAEFVKGTFVIFKGPLKSNNGKEILPAGKELPRTATELEQMDYFVQGVTSE